TGIRPTLPRISARLLSFRITYNRDFSISRRVQSTVVPFPIHRKRRLRSSDSIRRLVRETRLDPSQLILPLFTCPGEGVRREISSMPGNFQLSIDELVRECAVVYSLGIGGVILFGIPDTKDEFASEAYAENGITQRAVRAVKAAVPNLL